MKHLKKYNSLIFESVTNISDSDIQDRVNKLIDYIYKNPTEKNSLLNDLEAVKNGLNDKGEWVGEKEDSNSYEIWGFHYKGFTPENMKKLIAGINAKLGTEEVNKIIEIAKGFLQKYPASKDFLLQSVTYELQKLGTNMIN